MRLGKTFLLGVFCAACGSGAPTNFAGTYTVTVIDGTNDCQFNDWKQGNASTNITATITQDVGTAQLVFPSSTLLGTFLILYLGSNSFSGTVTGDNFTANLLGTKSTTVQGTNCTYAVNMHLEVTLDSQNNLSGTLTYTPSTNGDPSCGVLNTCTNSQTVTGARVSP